MSAPPTTLCEQWTTADEMGECGQCNVDDYTADQIERAINYASMLLFRLTGRRWPGVCTDTVNPSLFVNCYPNGRVWLDGWTPPYVPYHTREGWQNAYCGNCFAHLDCIQLPGPIVEITEVIVEGAVLDPSAYQVKGWAQLCRTDGYRWPVGTNPADDTFVITWTRGREIPDEARDMASLVACARLPLIACADDCNGPVGGVEQIAADGVTVNLADRQPTAETPGLTGIYIVDEWIRSVNPYGRQRRATVGDALSRMRGAAKWTT